MIKIAPSILSADFLRLGEELKKIESAGADRVHVDVMDGRFVPNITLGIPVVKAVKRGTALPIETHLMIQEPERYVEAFAQAGAGVIIVHQENAYHLDRTVQAIKDAGARAGVAINPATPAETLNEIIPELDLILVMTVNPGFGGQSFLDYTVDKIRRLRETLDARSPGCELEVDGGIEPENAPKVVSAGARVLVAGTAVFGHKQSPAAGVKALLDSASSLPKKE
ncbi:MAG TPA: ribulose-phosphate 3-epimerase [Thermodesulfobacteriota bacterium]|nr:ribulose-phosphate 3-epimerase [Thermodesulfobacteriota bacterium]